jgi:glycosyltransferase involved in cell wall biosynthesis
MKILLLVAHPTINGPLPKLSPIMISQLNGQGNIVETSIWSAHSENESLIQKITQRPKDIQVIKQKLLSFHPDLMIVTTTHNWKAILRDLPLLISTRKLCPKIVMHFHGTFSKKLISPGSTLMKLFTRKILDLCDAVFLFSREEINEWSSFYPTRQYYFVDNPYIEQNKPSSKKNKIKIPTILFVGRLVKEKGIFDLIEALKIVKKKNIFNLLIVGDGPDKQKLKMEIDESGLNIQVVLAGYLSGNELKEAYRSASIFVLPSWREGFPLVLVEAMDFELPIVTTHIRGAVDRFVEGENCLFVNPRQPKQLASAIEKLLTDPDLCAKMGHNNKKKVKEYAPGVVGKRYFEILREVIQQ